MRRTRITPPTSIMTVLALLAALTAGCTSSRSTPGNPTVSTPASASPRSSSPRSSSPSSAARSSAAPDSSPSASPSSSGSTAATAATRSCLPDDGRTTQAILGCLGTELSAYWTSRLRTRVPDTIVYRVTLASLPKDCRGTTLPSVAFECPVNQTIYFTPGEVSRVRARYRGADLVYVLAYVLGHETGHVIQDVLRQPTRAQLSRLLPQAGSQLVEQQADCLSGAWAHQVTWLSATRFAAVADEEITRISDRGEIDGHGTPATRLAAIERGLTSGSPARCHITGFG